MIIEENDHHIMMIDGGGYEWGAQAAQVIQQPLSLEVSDREQIVKTCIVDCN